MNNEQLIKRDLCLAIAGYVAIREFLADIEVRNQEAFSDFNDYYDTIQLHKYDAKIEQKCLSAMTDIIYNSKP